MEGSREFLQALGFTSIMLPVEGQGKSILMPFDQQVPYNQAVGLNGYPLSQPRDHLESQPGCCVF